MKVASITPVVAVAGDRGPSRGERFGRDVGIPTRFAAALSFGTTNETVMLPSSERDARRRDRTSRLDQGLEKS